MDCFKKQEAGSIINTIIKIDNLTKDYGSGRGVFNISFSINKGETFGFLGPNGAGKTTAIRHLMGFIKPQEGATKILDLETFSNYHNILKNVGYIPGEVTFPSGLTGKELVKMMAELVGKFDEVRFKKLCDIFKVDDHALNSYTKQMSLGGKRKLAIITAFMHDPDILILDEPTSGLDPIMQDVFINFIKEEKARGKTILLSSHLFNEVEATCDRISIIKDGRIVDVFNTVDLKHEKEKRFFLHMKNKFDFEKLLQEIDNDGLFVLLDKDSKKLTLIIKVNDERINDFLALIKSYELLEFIHLKESLEAYFLRFYKNDHEFRGLK